MCQFDVNRFRERPCTKLDKCYFNAVFIAITAARFRQVTVRFSAPAASASETFIHLGTIAKTASRP